MNVSFTMPIRTRSVLNGAQGFSKGATFAAARARKAQKMAAYLETLAVVRVDKRGKKIVTITRFSTGKLDTDNLAASLKSVRDGIAAALGVDDGSDAVEWRYAQEKCPRGKYAVRVEIAAKESRQ